ncbi:MAG: hypothetical protein Q8S73_05810 [Deltaproteobacteria bacterium]|nr:hypothetical protein [Myxococcales bacterium]MDP3213598.1 hypothetical protein [Deltaproteobacteria bacterium]
MTPWMLGDRRRMLCGALGVLVLIAPSAAPAQRLRRASDAVHTGSSEPRRRRAAPDSSPSAPSPSSSGRRNPRWLRARSFLPYPYAWGYGGYDVPLDTSQHSPRSVAVVASLDGGMALSSIGRGGLGLRVLGASLEFELRYSAYAEPTDDQTLWVGLGRYRGAVTLADSAGARVRVFGGLLHWIDDGGSEFGGEGGIGLDAFPDAPWVISFDLSGGFVGRAALVGLRGTVGYLVGPVEIMVGWQHESVIPTVSGGSVDLSGPLAGLRLWR